MTVSTSAPMCASKCDTSMQCKAVSCTTENHLFPTTKKYPTKMSMEEIEVSAPCLHETMDSAVAACVAAQKAYREMPASIRQKVVDSIRATALQFAEDFALCAWSETGRGRYADKLIKQRLAANSTPGTEDICPKCFTGDHGMTTVDYAPFGVIGAVTPVTNPTATVINNSITILAGGNGVVFNPHPAAMRCTNRAIAVVNQAVRAAGGPCCLVCSVRVPTIESGGRMMTHPDTACNLITGGPAVVKHALASGKRSFCAGPGNPAAVVDETADIEVAAKGIYFGASFDNNMICSDEKQTFVVASVADKLVAEMKKLGAYLLTPEQTAKLTPICIPTNCQEGTHGAVDTTLVGQDAATLLSKIGVTDVEAEQCRLLICEVPATHPLIWTEQLMPIMPICRVPDFESALDLAKKSEYNYKHTSSIYSTDLKRITRMAQVMNTSLFIVNGSHTAGLAAGGEGYTSFSIAGTTGEGMTRPSTFVRERRLVCVDSLRFV